MAVVTDADNLVKAKSMSSYDENDYGAGEDNDGIGIFFLLNLDLQYVYMITVREIEILYFRGYEIKMSNKSRELSQRLLQL